jgi:hypothetical protein
MNLDAPSLSLTPTYSQPPRTSEATTFLDECTYAQKGVMDDKTIWA